MRAIWTGHGKTIQSCTARVKEFERLSGCQKKKKSQIPDRAKKTFWRKRVGGGRRPRTDQGDPGQAEFPSPPSPTQLHVGPMRDQGSGRSKTGSTMKAPFEHWFPLERGEAEYAEEKWKSSPIGSQGCLSSRTLNSPPNGRQQRFSKLRGVAARCQKREPLQKNGQRTGAGGNRPTGHRRDSLPSNRLRRRRPQRKALRGRSCEVNPADGDRPEGIVFSISITTAPLSSHFR